VDKEQIIKEIHEVRRALWNKSETHSDVEVDIALTNLIRKIGGKRK
jgi:hypothetical protein